MKKRALSWLLALTMLLTLAPQTLPVWASAEEPNGTATQTESKLSANTYSALGLSRNVSNSEKPAEQPYGKAEVGNTIATNVINELYVNFNGSIHYGWSILDNIPMEYRDGADIGNNWTSSDNFYGAMGYWRPNQQTVEYSTGSSTKGALFATNKAAGEHDDHLGKSINSANKHLTYQYSKSEAFSPNTGKDNYVAEMVLDTDNNVWLYIYQVEGKNKRYVRGASLGENGFAGNKNTVIWNWEYDAMLDIAAGDMDGDGYDEIAVYSANKVSVYSYKNNQLKEIATHNVLAPGDREHSTEAQYKKLGSAIVTLAFGDLDADDKDELVIAENMPYWSHNIEKGTVRIYALKNKGLEPKHDLSLQYNNDPYAIRYVNVATGDIDGDNKDELIAAGYYSGYENYAKCSRDNIWYNIVKVEDGQYKNSGWKSTEFKTQDLLGRVVDNEKQLIPPVALTCAATQGVGYAEQVFLGGCLYTVKNDNSLEYLTRISTNREYKKDDGKKANKEEIFVVNVVAGNFNGNRNGQEQIVYAFGMKHDDSDRYWYDIGYINKKNPGNSDSDYWYGQEQVMNFESSYNRDQNKRRASLYLSLAAVDCDNDSTLMRYKGQEVTWTKPEVLTILQSAPYFQDLEDTRGYINQGQTGYGKGQGSGSSATAGTSLSVGAYVSFEQDFSVFGVKIASIQAEAQTKHSFNYGYEHNQTVETEVNYSGSAGDDYAVVYAVPFMEYQYETWVPGYKLPTGDKYTEYLNQYLEGKLGKDAWAKADQSAERLKAQKELGITPGMEVKGSWQPCTVSVPMTPRTVMLSVDDYDDIANVTEGLQPIRGNILNSTPGDPTTYDAVGSRGDKFNAIGNVQTVTKAQGSNTSVTQTSTQEDKHSFEYEYEFEAKVGAGAGGLTVGVLAGFGANAGGGISKSTSKSYSATVDNLPSDADGYTLSWQFGWRKAKLNNNDVLVLEYQQKDTKAKPSPPKNLRVESVTSDSVTLTWDPVTGAGAYKIYQVEKSNNGKLDLFPMKKLAGTATSWTDEGLSSNTNYIYVAQTITQSGEQSITSTQVNASTLEAQGGFKITKQPRQEDATTYAGGTVSFSVEAECRDTNNNLKDLHYQWQVYDKQEKEWKPLSDGENSTYHATVNEQNNGDRYRCRVYRSASLYLYSTEVTLKIDRAASLTAWASTPNDMVKSTYFITKEVEARDEKDNLIYADVPEVVDGRTKYSYQSGDETKYIYVETTTGTNGKETYKYYLSSDANAAEIMQVEPEVLTFGDESYNITRGTSGTVPAGKKYTVAAGTGDVTSPVEYVPTEVYNLTLDGQKVDLYHYFNDSTTDPEEFWFVEVTEGGQLKQYVADVEKVKKLKIDDNTLIDISSLAVCTKKSTDPATTTVQEKQAGDTVKLTVNVADANTGNNKIPTGSVTFKVVNTTGDGGFTKDVEIKDGKAEISWNPTTSGVYTVTAIYSGSDIFKESQSQIITINVVTPGEKKLVVSGGNMTYGGTQELKATLFDGKRDSESTTDVSAEPVTVTYAVTRDGNDVTSSNEITTDSSTGKTMFKPSQAGTYTITATYTPANTSDATTNNSITTTKVIVVGRKTVKIVPDETNPSNYTLVGANGTDDTFIRSKNKITLTCAGTADGAKAGEYPITVTYAGDGDIDNKYLIVCDNEKKYTINDSVVKVKNITNISNGRVILSYQYNEQTYEVGGSNYNDVVEVPKGAKLIATAMPNLGYRVEQWKVNSNTQMNGVTPVTNPTFEIQIPENTTLENWTVEATFTQIYYKLNYSIENGGEITAKYLTDNGGTGTPFNSGDQLSPLQKVQLTAEPASGQAICEWQVDGETIKNKDGTNYTGATYEVSSISKETSIVVKTEQTSECPVTVTVVGSDNQPLGNATVSFNPAREATDGTYPGQKNQSLTITLNIPDSLIVESWSTAAGQEMQGTLSSDKKKLTISNLRSALNLTVKCVTPNMYTVTQAVNAGGRIEVYKGLTDNTPLSFTDSEVDVPQASLLRVLVKPDDGYQVKSVTVGDTPPTLNDIIGSEDKSFVINSVYGPTTIHVEFVKKPVVTFTAVSNGTIEVSNGPSVNGGTVPYGYKNDIVFTAKPEHGYEVDKWTVNTTEVNGQKVANSDNQTYTYTPGEGGITSDVTVEVSFKKLPTATVNFSVIDKNGATLDGGFDGTIKATVTRYGTATPYDSGTIANVYRDSVVTFVATPNPGYAVTKWIVNDEKQTAQPTLNIGTEDDDTTKTVKVQFDEISKEIKYGITADSDANHGGTLKVTFLAKAGSKPADDIKSGTSVKTAGTLTAEVTGLNDNYEIESWTLNGAPYTLEDGNNSKLTCDVSETQGADIRVKIVRKSYQINFSAMAGGTITATANENPLQNPATVKGDTSIFFTASNPATGYEFTGWKVGDTMIQGTELSYTLTVKKDTTVQACYAMTQTQYAVTYGIIKTGEQDNGTLSVSGLNRQGKANAGSTITFTATPAAGYQVKQWYSAATGGTEIGTAESKEYQITNLTENTGVYVQFEPIPSYEITVNVTGQGSVTATVNDEAATISENKLTVKRHDNVVLTASPATSQYLTNWTLDNEPKGNDSLTLTLSDVKENHTVAANFDASQGVPFKTICGTDGTLEAKAGYGDKLTTIDAASGISVDKGKKIVLTAKPEIEKAVVWTVNGKPTDELSNTYTIDAISANTEVQASFETLHLFNLPTASGSNYDVSVLEKYPNDYGGTNEVRRGGNISFKVTPKAGKLLGVKAVSPDGTVVANADGSYTVTIENVTSNITFQMEEYKAEPGNLIIPNGYTEASLKSALRTQISPSVSGSNIKYLDIKLKISTGSGWQDVTADNFPKGGINITISYGTLGNGLDKSYNYSVAHMRTDGTIENLPATNGESGITFHVNSLSPFAIGWYKNTPTPGGGGGGGGGAVSTYTLTFDTNGGSAIDKITKDSGTTIDLAAYKPTRAGYTFTGWFSDKALTKAVTSVKLTANTTVYAKWTQSGGTAQNPFVDVKEGAYYYDAVLWAVEQKITSGTSATTFSPDASCTRAQMVTFLWRAAGSPKVENGKNPFTDVQADAYYYDAVLWAVEKGVTSGTSATTFSPDATVTRGQTVTFLYRNAGSPEVSGTMPFTDVEADAYYAKAVQWAVQQKITTGTSETTFSPMSDCTRGQIVTFLYRAK